MALGQEVTMSYTDGEDWVTIGLRGHILEPDFATALVYKKRGGWQPFVSVVFTFDR